jgi:hypothetical protein
VKKAKLAHQLLVNVLILRFSGEIWRGLGFKDSIKMKTGIDERVKNGLQRTPVAFRAVRSPVIRTNLGVVSMAVTAAPCSINQAL